MWCAINPLREGVAWGTVRAFPRVCIRLLVAALAGWAVLVSIELIVLYGALRVFALWMGPELLPSLKVVLDMVALAASGWTAGRVGRPRVIAAAALTAGGLSAFDLTPYFPLNGPWLLHLIRNAAADGRYVSSLVTTLTMHAVLFGSLFAGAHLSRPRRGPTGLGLDHADGGAFRLQSHE